MRSGGQAPVWLWFSGFVLAWTGFVVLGWRLSFVPDILLPALRAVIWIAAVAVWVWWQRIRQPLGWVGLWPVTRKQLGWTALAFALVLGGNLLRTSAGSGSALAGLALPLATYLTMVVGVFVEELLFRGVLQTRLTETGWPKLAIVLAALAFLAIHVPGWLILQIPVGPGTATSIFLIGYFCGVFRAASSSLWPAVAAHLANNLGAML